MVDYGKFEKSLKHLEAQLRNYRDSAQRHELSDIDREAIAESVIQRFETCYDCLWLIYADARTSTSHDYSGEKAQATINTASVFAQNAAALYEKMTGKPWT